MSGRIRWLSPHVDRVAELYKTKSGREVAGILGIRFNTVKQIVSYYELAGRGHLTPWDEEKKAELREMYPETTNADLAKHFGTTPGAIDGIAFKMKLFKSRDFKRRHAEKGMFKPGQVPPNKGHKMSPEVYEKAKATMFKKGNLPGNTKEDGAITIRADKREVEYRHIRISQGKWVQYGRYLWEQMNGAIPKGMCVRYKDENTLNDVIENLELITQKENYRRNSGSVNLSDGWVAMTLAGKNHPEMIDIYKGNPELLELKRQQLLLNREIKKQHDESETEG